MVSFRGKLKIFINNNNYVDIKNNFIKIVK